MKWRIVLAVLFVLTLFSGFAYLYVNAFVRKHQHAVILFVVPGLDQNVLNMARLQLGRGPLHGDPDDPAIEDARRRSAYRSEILNLDSFWNLALLNLQEAGQPVPDEGVDATALACGQRVENGFVAINHSGESLRSLIYAAEQAERVTGLVTTSSLVDPTPVAFYSTIKGTPEPYRNANDLLYSKIDIVLGGGESWFMPATSTNEWGRRDGRNLLNEAKEAGYEVVRTRDELNNVSTWPAFTTRQVFGLFAPGSFYFSSERGGNRRQPSLAEMVRIAIANLNYNRGGYLLVVEDGQVARAARENLGQQAIREVAELDNAIALAVEYAGTDALVIVTNSYSLGAVGPMTPPAADGLAMSAPTVDALGKPVKPPVPPLAPGRPPLWMTGPGGPTIGREQAAWLRQNYDNGTFNTNAPGGLQPDPAFRFQTAASILSEPAWMASRGEGSSQLRGFLNNTDVFDIISAQF